MQLKEKERRKSVTVNAELSDDNQCVESSDESWLRSSSNSSSSDCSLGFLWDRSVGGTSQELRLCLGHHLKRCLNTLKVVVLV